MEASPNRFAPVAARATANPPTEDYPSVPRLASHGGLRTILQRTLFVVGLLFAIRYLVWRVQHSMNPDHPWLFAVFFAAECMGILETALFYFTVWNPSNHKKVAALRDRTVDVFITTFDEPLDIVRETAVCAVRMSYPHRTFILDDGNRAEMKNMAAELGCEYIARTSREHAKAGNLNHAFFGMSKAEFVVLLDADHVPMPNLIEDTIGFFADEKIAIVQTPQDFYNLDSFQHKMNHKQGDAWQQQELFFSLIQPGKDDRGAAMFCGSPAVVRRSALEEIGGFATGTVTEDFHTSIRLQAKGYRILYFNRTLARGLAPQTYRFFATQWLRWGQGAMQIFRKERPLFRRGLSWKQRLCFFSSVYFYWMSYQKLILLLTPVLVLTTGIAPLKADLPIFWAYFWPYFISNVAAFAWVSGGLRSILLSEQMTLVKVPVLMKTTLGLRTKQRKFAVTPKAQGSSSRVRDLWPQIAILIAFAASIVMGCIRLYEGSSPRWVTVFSLFWAFCFMGLLLPIVRLALTKREQRKAYRFAGKLNIPVTFSISGPDAISERASTVSLNRHGLSMSRASALPLGSKIELKITLPDQNVGAIGRVFRNHQLKFNNAGTAVEVGIRFEQISPEAQDHISEYLFTKVAPEQAAILRLTRRSQAQSTLEQVPQIAGSSEPWAYKAGRAAIVILVLGYFTALCFGQTPSQTSQRATELLQEGKPADAVFFLQQALKENPSDAAIFRNLGKAHEWLGRFAESRDYYQRAIALDPNNGDGWYGLARVASWMGDRQASYKAYENALSLDPGNAEMQLSYAEVLSWDSRRRSDSVNRYRRIREQYPRLAAAQLGLAQALAWSGEIEKAESEYDDVLRSDPTNVQALIGKAEIAQWRLRPLHARDLSLTALRIAPRNPQVLRAAARAEISLGQYATAHSLADQLAALQYDQSIRVNEEIRHSQRTFIETGYTLRRDLKSPVDNRLSSDGFQTAVSMPLTSQTRWKFGFAPVIYQNSRHAYSANSYSVSLDSRPFARLQSSVMFTADSYSGKPADFGGKVSFAYLLSDPVRMHFEVDRSIVADSVHSAIGSAFGGTYLGAVRSNIASWGISITNFKRNVDGYMKLSGGFNSGRQLDPNRRMGVDAGIGKALRLSNPYLRLGYGVTLFSFAQDQSFLPAPDVDLRRAGGYFSPELFWDNFGLLSVSGRIKNAEWAMDGSLGMQQVRDFGKYWQRRLSSTLGVRITLPITERVTLTGSYNFINAGSAYQRNVLAISLRTYL